MSYIVGVDLGQANDYTAIAVAEVRAPAPDGAETAPHYQIRHLERLELGTPYPQQVERVQVIMKGLKGALLVVDQTGVGRPVVDMLRAKSLNPYAVSIHGGDATTRDGYNYRVPKRELVSILQVLLQSKRLQVAKSLPDAQTLVEEMLAFKVTISQTGHDSYGNDWRENPHDDLVLATALACWRGEQTTHFYSLSPVWNTEGAQL